MFIIQHCFLLRLILFYLKASGHDYRHYHPCNLDMSLRSLSAYPGLVSFFVVGIYKMGVVSHPHIVKLIRCFGPINISPQIYYAHHNFKICWEDLPQTNVKLQQTHEKSLNNYVIKTHLFHGLFCVCDMLSTAPCVCHTCSHMHDEAMDISRYLRPLVVFAELLGFSILKRNEFPSQVVVVFCRFSFLNHTQDANWNAHLPAMFIHPSAKNT